MRYDKVQIFVLNVTKFHSGNVFFVVITRETSNVLIADRYVFM